MNDRSASAEERSFGADEILYSRTDPRGLITFASPLLYKVAACGPGQMDGAPHSVTRHPDMPRGLFRLLWQTLQSDQPIGAYVKNLAGDGRFYWVFALINPVEDGYLSVAMRPQSPLFAAASGLYPQILAAEAAGAPPEESAALLLEGLAGLGFASYASFHAAAMVAEAQAQAAHRQDEALGGRLGHLADLRAATTRLADENVQLMDLFTSLHLVPTNMRLLASRLEPAGGPITAISDSYKRASAEIIGLLHRLAGGEGQGGAPMTAQINEAAFRLSAAAIQDMACAQFLAEAARSSTSAEAAAGARAEAAILGKLARSGAGRAQTGITDVSALVQRLRRDDEVLLRQMSGLDQIRILGQVESGRNRNKDSGLASVMTQLSGFHDAIHSRLDAILTLTAQMRAITRDLEEPDHPLAKLSTCGGSTQPLPSAA